MNSVWTLDMKALGVLKIIGLLCKNTAIPDDIVYTVYTLVVDLIFNASTLQGCI